MKPTVIISWVFILLIAGGIPIMSQLGQRQEKTAAHATGPDWQFEFMARYSVGAARAFNGQTKALQDQIDQQAKYPQQKIAAAVVAGELSGADEAIDRLTDIDDTEAASIKEFFDSPTVAASAPRFGERYPWLFDLARTHSLPDQNAERMAIRAKADGAVKTTFILIITLIFVGAIGVTLLLAAIILLATGWLKFRTASPGSRGVFYVESFAIYLTLWVLISLLVGIVLPDAPIVVKMFPMLAVVVFAAAWPMIRGLPFEVFRRDIGIHLGRGLFTEIGTGILGYLAGLPIVAVGFLITFILMKVSGESSTHPIAFEMNSLSPWILFLMVSVFAPLTEELMFRGIFVSHLRSWTGIVLSAVISGVIFAAIHPQGWPAIPLLCAMGAVFALVRQWRDSLVPSIAAHALNNAMAITIMLLLMR